MGKSSNSLSGLELRRLATPGLHAVGHVSGLALQIAPTGAKSWILRYRAGGRRRDMGLGGYPSVTLAGACEAAREARKLLRAGVDPIEDARAKRSALAAVVTIPTFEKCAEKYIAAHEAGWKRPKHAIEKAGMLRNYAHPHFGKLRVNDITTTHVVEALEPVWRTKPAMAKRLRLTIEAVLAYAKAKGYRDGENPATWRGKLDKLLPRLSKVHRVTHMASLPYGQIGGFMPKLRAVGGMGARALEFAILTAARSGEVRFATWADIDLAGATWTVPASKMKTGTLHRVPLSPPALALLRNLPRIEGSDYVFAGATGGALSDMGLTAVLRRLEVPVTAHGFRSTFRTWVAEVTAHQREIAEVALSHAVGDAVEQAYQRGDLFEKRRRLMADWARFCATPAVKPGAVVPMRKGAA